MNDVHIEEGGSTIRAFGLMPDTFIAVFYTGLGRALALAGVEFATNYVQYDIV